MSFKMAMSRIVSASSFFSFALSSSSAFSRRASDTFFAPERVTARPTRLPQVCAVGLERRDYETLLQGVEQLPVEVVIAAASPWAKSKEGVARQSIPSNVTVRKFTQYELRQLYADSLFMVMPLEDVNFQAGVTAILECTAMGKAVVCSRVPGQTDVVVEGHNGRYVPPRDPYALRTEIEWLLSRPEEAIRLGKNGRQLVEHQMNLNLYVDARLLATWQADRLCVHRGIQWPTARGMPEHALVPVAGGCPGEA